MEVPIYSAVKVNGKKLYEYAREGKKVELPRKIVYINSIELLNVNGNKFTFKCNVSKGTYIRSLINDLAKILNTFGVMENLRRTKQGNFDINQAVTLEQVEKKDYKLLPIDLCLPPYKRITVENENEVINGKMFDNIYNEPIIFENKNKEPIAIYKIYEKDNKKIKPWKMLKKLNNIKK